jgi:anti-sigma-K factor RskA
MQPWVDRYSDLEDEYATATDARKSAIRQEQSAIITRGIQYNSYTEARLEASKREWREIMSLQ